LKNCFYDYVTLTSKSLNDPHRDPFDWFGGRKLLRANKTGVEGAEPPQTEEQKKFKELGVTLRDNGFRSCCGSFITLGANFRKNDVNTYLKLREYTSDERLRDEQTARVGFEFIVYDLWDDPAAPRDLAAAWYREADDLAKTSELSSKMKMCV
jgi:hypothetical protein